MTVPGSQNDRGITDAYISKCEHLFYAQLIIIVETFLLAMLLMREFGL